MTQEIPQETTASADPIAEIKADIAAYESIFAELTRAMDPAALLKVLTYLVRNAKRDASENQTFDTLEHRRLVARVDALMAQVQPEARKQAISTQLQATIRKVQLGKLFPHLFDEDRDHHRHHLLANVFRQLSQHLLIQPFHPSVLIWRYSNRTYYRCPA
mgnify:CR=1 FL=1